MRARRGSRRQAARRRDGLVRCAGHGPRPCYAVCGHVLEDDAAVAYERRPGVNAPIGELACENCYDRKGPNDQTAVRAFEDERARVVCDLCAIAKGWVSASSPAGGTS